MLKFVDNKKSYKTICSYCVHDPEVYTCTDVFSTQYGSLQRLHIVYITGFLERVCQSIEVTQVTSLERLRFDALRHPYNESNEKYWTSKHEYTKLRVSV